MNCADDVEEAKDDSSSGDEDDKKQAAPKAYYEAVADDSMESKIATLRGPIDSSR
jgi:hypothetical protein